MHSSNQRNSPRIPAPPDWLSFLVHASAHAETERRAWCRDVLSREPELLSLCRGAARGGWFGPDPGENAGPDALLHVLGTEAVLNLAARLSMSRWFSRVPPGDGLRAADRILGRSMITATLLAALAEELDGRRRSEAELCGLLAGTGPWSGRTGDRDEDIPGVEDLLRAWEVDPGEWADWPRLSVAWDAAGRLQGKKENGADEVVPRLAAALAPDPEGTAAVNEAVCSLELRLRAEWAVGENEAAWPGRVPGVIRKVLKNVSPAGRDCHFAPALRRLQHLVDHPASPQVLAGRLLDFTAAFLPGMILGVGWRGGGDEPGSSWWRCGGNGPRPLPAPLAAMTAEDAGRTVPAADFADRDFPGRGPVAVLPVRGAGNAAGWIVAARRDGRALSRIQADMLRFTAARMSGAARIQAWQERCRAETSKKELLQHELLQADRRLSAMEKWCVELEQSVIYQNVLPGIFHTLKNKVTPVMGYAQMLRLRNPDDYTAERLEKIERSAEALAGLLNRLRSRFGNVPRQARTGNLNRLLRHLQPRLQALAAPRGVEIVLDAGEGVADFTMSGGQLEMLVLQGVDNALRALDAAPSAPRRIRLQTRQLDSGECELRIRDRGCGIAPEDRERIWAPFFSRFTDADGLGLSLCDLILQAHGARRRVESRPGGFTEFVFTFPAERPGAPAPRGAAEPDMPRGRVLILDDEAYMMELMRDILQEVGDLEIHTTTSGARALRWLKEQEYDLVIADLYLPDINGLDVFRTLNERGMAERLILVTADPGGGEVRDFLESRHIVLLRKPLELMTFKQKVLEKLSQEEA